MRAQGHARIFCALLSYWGVPALVFAQDVYVSALGGFAALSGDAGTDLSGPIPRVALYDPRNGPALNLAGGVHWNDWVSLQGNYIWNRNDVTFTEVQGSVSRERTSETSQNALCADALLFFRPRRDRIRPYLSAGVAAVHIRSSPSESTWKPGLRVAVGIDLMFGKGWGFRYSFSEMLTGNVLNQALNPSGGRNLMNFQNLFGVVKYF